MKSIKKSIIGKILFFLELRYKIDTISIGNTNKRFLTINLRSSPSKPRIPKIKKKIKCKIIVKKSNDPRSYRLSSNKLKKLGDDRLNVQNKIQKIVIQSLHGIKDIKNSIDKSFYDITIFKYIFQINRLQP